MQHLCIRTLRPSHTESFEDAWTFSLEASRASLFHRQVLEKQLKTLVTSSPSLQKESESANLELFSSKTYKESSVATQGTENQFSSMSSEHWKKWVTEQRQEYSQRKKSAHLINAKESSSWATPIENDSRGSDYSGRRDEVKALYLGGQVKKLQESEKATSSSKKEENWPTPTIAEVSGGMRLDQIKSGKWGNIQLREKIALMEEQKQKNWATPQTFDHVNIVRTPEKLAQTRAEKNAGCMNLREQVHYPDMDHSRKAAKNWPTATTRDWKDTNATVPPSRTNPSKQTLGQRVAHVGLQDQPKLSTNGKNQESWSTPQARDWKGAEGRAYKGQTKDLPSQTEAMGKLNPNWVEQLMGITVGWTDLGYWETESFQQQQLKHSSHLSKE